MKLLIHAFFNDGTHGNIRKIIFIRIMNRFVVNTDKTCLNWRKADYTTVKNVVTTCYSIFISF